LDPQDRRLSGAGTEGDSEGEGEETVAAASWRQDKSKDVERTTRGAIDGHLFSLLESGRYSEILAELPVKRSSWPME